MANITLQDGLTALAALAAALIVAHLLRRVVQAALAKRGVETQGAVSIAIQLVYFTLIAIGIAIALETIGVNLGALFAAGAFFAAAIAFAIQNVAQNFVSGLTLFLERLIKPGDVLEVEGRVVRVTQMGLRATIARSRDEEDLIIPNSVLVLSTVKSFTLRDPEYRVRTTVGVHYDSDLDQAVAALERACKEIRGQPGDREPRILLSDFGNSSVDFEVSIWIEDPWRARMIRSELNFAIWRALHSAKITIAYPQLDVHLQPPGALQSGENPPPPAGRPT